MNRTRQKRVGRTGSRFDVRKRRRNKRKSGAYHYWPLLEVLEQRRLLTSVTGKDPLPNTHDAPVTTDVSAVFDSDINPATVSAGTFAVHGMQTGQILESLSVSGDTLTLSPDAPFHPGELVQATVTTGIENLSGEALADPYVWQFRTAASGGTGLFSDNGQSLGDSWSDAVALGDLDGDGDLDAFVGSDGDGNIVWLNQDPVPGDFDNDLDVDGDDFLIWQAGFGIQTGATLDDGDADGDGDVDGDDFLIWQTNFGTGAARTLLTPAR